MIKITIENTDSARAKTLARQVYDDQVARGRHCILDVPGEMLNSLPLARMTAADVIVHVPGWRQIEPKSINHAAAQAV